MKKFFSVFAVLSFLFASRKAFFQTKDVVDVAVGSSAHTTLAGAIKAGNGKAEVKTVNGAILVASIDNGKVKLTDKKGNSAFVTAVDLAGSNGVIHVIDGVLLPQ